MVDLDLMPFGGQTHMGLNNLVLDVGPHYLLKRRAQRGNEPAHCKVHA